MIDARYPAGPPDFTDPIAGVRIWRVAPTLWWQMGGLLWSPAMREPWPTGEVYRAACRMDHAPGSAGCGCGVYSFYTPELAKGGSYWPTSDREIAGVIGASGEVDLSSVGMRSGSATIEAIFTAGAPDSELPLSRQEIADGYGAEVIDPEDFEEFCDRRALVREPLRFFE
jgi:hypothetical protein